jgi:two-component system LytT family response regulator
MNALIIDDEKHGAETLRLLIGRHCKEITVLGVEYSAESAIERIPELRPDIVFLDIEMPTALGFDVIEATKECAYEVIFTTAYSQYAIRAFKTQAIDYLLKPIDVDELVSAVGIAAKRIEEKRGKSGSNGLDALLKKVNGRNRKITIPTGEGIIFVSAEELVYLESDSNYTHIYFKDGRKILISKTLKSMEEQLKDSNFCRVHSTYLVNLDEIDRYVKGDGGTLILKNNTSVPVSRANKQELMMRLGL